MIFITFYDFYTFGPKAPGAHGTLVFLIFFEDFFAQHLAHKTFFSIFSWIFFAILLWGRHTQGWRGKTAVRWTLSGFITLAVAYWGTKFVLEVLLSS